MSVLREGPRHTIDVKNGVWMARNEETGEEWPCEPFGPSPMIKLKSEADALLWIQGVDLETKTVKFGPCKPDVESPDEYTYEGGASMAVIYNLTIPEDLK